MKKTTADCVDNVGLYVSQQFTAHHLTRDEAEEAASAIVETVAALDAMSIEEIWEIIEKRKRFGDLDGNVNATQASHAAR